MTGDPIERSALVVFDGERSLDAVMVLEGNCSPWVIILESRSGSRSSGRARNPDYVSALELIVARLCDLSAVLEDVSVVSSPAMKLDAAQRRLPLAFPLQLHLGDNAVALRKNLTEAQRSIARTSRAQGTTGGNNNKRLRLEFSVAEELSAAELIRRLAGVSEVSG